MSELAWVLSLPDWLFLISILNISKGYFLLNLKETEKLSLLDMSSPWCQSSQFTIKIQFAIRIIKSSLPNLVELTILKIHLTLLQKTISVSAFIMKTFFFTYSSYSLSSLIKTTSAPFPLLSSFPKTFTVPKPLRLYYFNINKEEVQRTHFQGLTLNGN